MRELALTFAAALGWSAIGCGDSTGIGGEAGETESSSTGTESVTEQDSNSNSDPSEATQTVTDSADVTGSSSDTSATATITDTESRTDTDSSSATTSGTVSDTDTATESGTTSSTVSDTDTTPTGTSASDTESVSDSDPTTPTDSVSTTGTTDDGASASDPSATSTSSDSDASGSTSDTDDTTGGDECVIAMCGNHLYECGDCEDNDGDVGVDGLDIECVSPCDDDESSFATGIPGDNVDPCNQDCFFDGNSGAGDDGCEWNLACDPANPGGLECPYDPNETNCPPAQDQDCVDNCEVPNGCDCFGCCAVTVDGIDYEIFIGDDCELDDIDNCATCTQQATCGDPCDPDDCELCFGETELPPNCSEPSCAIGQESCFVNGDCPEGDFCQTGCCVPIPS